MMAGQTHSPPPEITPTAGCLQRNEAEHCISRESLLLDCEPAASGVVCYTPVSAALHYQPHQLITLADAPSLQIEEGWLNAL